MSSLIGGTEGPWIVNVHIWHGEDWYEPLYIVDINGEPFDLTGVTLEWFARPSLDHSTRFVHLSSGSDGGIIFEDAPLGLAAIFYQKEDVEANLPINIGGKHWQQFLRMTFDDPDLGFVERHLFLGELYVRPAKEFATV